ncbi:MAG: TPM domain-containing protein [Bacteroidales bacterium]|nr:TPM domain-containing protein [Bacteroidales bacterium]MCF8386814.1 TPM domain-containing protein [Bacteroidales bacterium]MCF8398649.1 TPM domain-containing protein [Bacteroidales bacterium]
MIKRNTTGVFIFLILLISHFTLHAQEIPERPSPPRLVNDFSGTLTPAEINSLERKLVNFFDTTSNQIAVVFVKSLQGYDPAQFAYKIGESWGVGSKDFNNGIVILVKPKTNSEKGRTFIATGYGLEGAIPDAIGKRIVENEMIPEFKNNNYYNGINKATNVLMALASGEYSKEQYRKENQNFPLAGIIPFIVIMVIFILINISRRRTYSMGGRKERGTDSLWTALFLGSMLGSTGRHHSGGWGNFSGGSRSFGGGGSFGGFGGGSFGGGGAGGSW